MTDTTGAIRFIGFEGALGPHSRADSVVARLARAFGPPRGCARDDWQWRIPDGEVNVSFQPVIDPNDGTVWYLAILAEWREPRLKQNNI